jgi:phthiocerol/phenolphthiocerol synthesis type-I polyketide synthase C
MPTIPALGPQTKNSSLCTVLDFLKFRSSHQSTRTAFTFLKDGETERLSLTYRQLNQRSRALAAFLHTRGLSGERALLLLPSGPEFMIAFYGCLYSGVIAVPVYPPQNARGFPRIEAIASNAKVAVVITDRESLAKTQALLERNPTLGKIEYIPLETLTEEPAGEWEEPAIDPNTLAFLQYTSGSTGAPKGVMVSHGNILANLEMIRSAFDLTQRDIGLSWLPLFHDMGLVGHVLAPIYAGAHNILMSPTAFLQKPTRWLRAISKYHSTVSGAPNFAYDLCLRKIPVEERATLDLSHWRVAFNGAEPIRPTTLQVFSEAFSLCGFRNKAFLPCYGMAEATLIISGGPSGRSPAIMSVDGEDFDRHEVMPTLTSTSEVHGLVGCGNTSEQFPEQDVAIANPETRIRCDSGQIGEIWVAGPHVAKGYWARALETQATFETHLASGEGPFLRTGDLGFLHDGELVVTGRLKDLIVIRGRNVYPQDIEWTVERSHSALQPGSGAAFPVDVDGQEQLVVVQELLPRAKPELDDVLSNVRQAVAEEHDLAVHDIVLIKPGAIPKTSSGKIQRQATRAKYLADELKAVSTLRSKAREQRPEVPSCEGKPSYESMRQSQGASVADVTEWLVTELSQRLGVEPSEIDTRHPFTYYGLGSLECVELAGKLETWIGRSVSPTLAWYYPSVDAIASYLGQDAVQPPARPFAATRAAEESIAIIGVGCRFPGAENPDAFWQLLKDGKDAISAVPAGRWPPDIARGSLEDENGYPRFGGFLDSVDQFDASFFGISPREAESMDPQQRLLLEVAWEALENAGQAPNRLAGSETGVFVGISSNDYSLMQFRDPALNTAYTGTGNAHSVAASRLSYFLDLRGPSLAVDTACSSSLAAVDMACQNLRAGRCQLALAGGVNLILSPELTLTFAQAGMLSPDGRCKTFDATADGYVRGEGCGVLVFKRLQEAKRDGDNVLAVIRGTATNQDGRSNGLTAPNGLAQQAVILQALADARVAPHQIGYVEAHGTGTPLGDPIEFNALKAALLERPASGLPRDSCAIGSVKTNIGHLEAAAGIAGLIKVILALQHETIPPHLHLKNLNPNIDLEGGSLSIPTEAQPWPRGSRQRLAGVSSFGFGGTNVHVILEEAPAPPLAPSNQDAEPPWHILALSARSETALQALARRFRDWLVENVDAALVDVCFTAGLGRSHFAHRAGLVVASREQLTGVLAKLATGEAAADKHVRRAKQRPKLALLFTGQGSQYAGMGKALYATQPVFKQTLDRCTELLEDKLDAPLRDVIFEDAGGMLGQTRWTQPALFAVEVALYETYRSLGIEAGVVLGHSVGEYAAAYAAGILTLEDGLQLIAKRGELFGSLPEGGSMAAIFADATRVQAVVDEANAGLPPSVALSIAAYNGVHVVVSGPAELVDHVIGRFEAEDVRCARLETSHAFHSALLEPALWAFEPFAATIAYRRAELTLISNLTGQALASDLVLDAPYWRRHAREPVQFARSVAALAEAGVEVLLELGPHPVLTAMALHCWPGESPPPAAFGALRRGVPADRSLLDSIAQLYAAGSGIDFAALDAGRPRRKLSLPTYPFQRQRYWVNAPKQRVLLGETVHPLLGVRQRMAGSTEQRFEQVLSGDIPAWLADQRVYDWVVFPAAGYVELALSASGGALRDLSIDLPLVVERPIFLQTLMREAGSIEIFSQADGEAEWRRHATAQRDDVVEAQPAAMDLAALKTRCGERIEPESLYKDFAAAGLTYGPQFRTLRSLHIGEEEVLAWVDLGEDLASANEYRLAPMLLDGAFQALTALQPGDDQSVYLPTAVDAVYCHGSLGASAFVWGRWRIEGNRRTADVRLCDEQGRVLAELRGLQVRRATRQAFRQMLEARAGVDELLYRIRWQRSSEATANEVTPGGWGGWLLLGDERATLPLAEQLATRGQEVQCSAVQGVAALLDGVMEKEGQIGSTPLAGVVLVGGKNGDAVSEACANAEAALQTVQTLLACGVSLSRGLTLLTQRAIAIDVAESVQPGQAVLWGLGRTLQLEQPQLNVRLLDVDRFEADSLADVLVGAGESQQAIRGGQVFRPRLTRVPHGGRLAMPAGDAALSITQRGSLDKLQLTACAVDEPAPGEVQVEVHAAGLNFRDVLNALGAYPGDPGPLGGEAAGVVAALGDGVRDLVVGDPVFGMIAGSFATRCNTPTDWLVRMPANLDFAAAATVPIAFCTAQAVFELAKLQSGERVLIHAAAGGVGLAAIQLAQALGAEIYATASEAKQGYLRELGIEHIYDSHSSEFGDQILHDTGGAGVELVLNSLTGPGFVAASLDCLGDGGRFIEIGKRDIWSTEQIADARPDVTYHILALDDWMVQEPHRVRGLLAGIAGRLETDELRPLRRRIYPLAEAPAAMRTMQQARHIGKIVLSIEHAAVRANASYLITGGLGALGLAACAWLAEQGARHLVLTSRREPDKATRERISAIEAVNEGTVLVRRTDVADAGQVQALTARFGRKWPELAGIIHAAGTLDDGLITEQTAERFEQVMRPKVRGAWNLHWATQDRALDFFVLYSSVASALGSAGQGNYAAANAFLDGLAQYRRAQGLAALSINWGPWAEGGMATSPVVRARMAKQGIMPLEPAAAHRAMAELLASGVAGAVVLDADWQRMSKRVGGVRPALLSTLLRKPSLQDESALLQRLRQVPASKREQVLLRYLQGELQQILGLAEPPDAEAGFFDLGMDSLTAVELHNRLLQQLGEANRISNTIAFDYPSLGELAGHLAETQLASTTIDQIEPVPRDAHRARLTAQGELLFSMRPTRS